NVSVTSRRASPTEKVLGTCDLPRLVTSASPPATNKKMVATSTSGTADSTLVRHIQPSARRPSAMPASEYALSPSFVPNAALDASHKPTTCATSVSVSTASATAKTDRHVRVRDNTNTRIASSTAPTTHGHGDGGGT